MDGVSLNVLGLFLCVLFLFNENQELCVAFPMHPASSWSSDWSSFSCAQEHSLLYKLLKKKKSLIKNDEKPFFFLGLLVFKAY